MAVLTRPPPDPPDSRTYLAWCAGAAAAISVLVALAAIAIDPYRVFGTPTLPGINEIKPRAYQQASLAKKHQLLRSGPRTLLLGNSRVEIGLDPGSERWPSELRPVFNGAQAGVGYALALIRLEQALAAGAPLRLVVLGLDFQDFLVPATPPGEDGVRPEDRGVEFRWSDMLTATLTLGALADSLATLAGQDSETGVTMLPDGFNPLRDYRLHARQIGYHGLFAQKEAENRKSLLARPRVDFAVPETLAPVRLVRRLLHLATASGVEVVLFFHPYHARYLDQLEALGLWDGLEVWKRAMVRLTDEEGSQRGARIRLIDFSGYYEGITTEPVPAAGDLRTAMRWYWEAGHYKATLGELILARLLARGGDGFGTELHGANIEAHLSRLRQDRTAARLSRTGMVGTSGRGSCPLEWCS